MWHLFTNGIHSRINPASILAEANFSDCFVCSLFLWYNDETISTEPEIPEISMNSGNLPLRNVFLVSCTQQKNNCHQAGNAEHSFAHHSILGDVFAGAFLEVSMKKLQSLIHSFSKGEIILWSSSVFFILLSFFLFDRENYLTLAASLIGATSLIFCAKGNPFGQLLMMAFSILYGIVSFTFAYYGEMITYLGMTLPMAVFSFISWIRNPYDGNKSEVRVNRLKGKEIAGMIALTAAITFIFYFILEAFHTTNLIPSTISVATSFLAAYLTFRRSAYFALAYAANDLILILLWSLATITDLSYLSVVICFVVFFINDLYGFINWRKMCQRQNNTKEETSKISG